MLRGEIGSLVQDGRQIGGFLNWTIDLNLIGRESPDGKVYKKALTKATAEKFWVLCESSGEIEAFFYQLMKDKLVLINKAQVNVQLGTIFNKIINKPLEMIWMS